jgi:hypothetical protein
MRCCPTKEMISGVSLVVGQSSSWTIPELALGKMIFVGLRDGAILGDAIFAGDLEDVAPEEGASLAFGGLEGVGFGTITELPEDDLGLLVHILVILAGEGRMLESADGVAGGLSGRIGERDAGEIVNHRSPPF